MVLGNFWTWSGGFPQYLKWSGYGPIPFPQDPESNWQEFTDYSQEFYNNERAQQMMNDHIKTVIERKNTITGTLYKDDPTIMSWQLANEPRGYTVPEKYRAWTRRTAAFIKELDNAHLVCLGSEGNTSGTYAGVNVLLDNDNKDVDYITMHIWAQNWGWFDPTQGEEKYQEAILNVDDYWDVHMAAANKLNKPMVLEEFGIARDESSFDPYQSTTWRDRFFDHLYKKVAHSIKNNEAVRGLNFWSYSGTVKPPRPGEYWKLGDVFTGDPPHEFQGWYGVYDTDKSTLNLIRKYTAELK
jgi:mannan endo-1,4-beta-mannosidase